MMNKRAAKRGASTAASLKDIYEELDFLSDLLSNRVRTISLSVLAMAWLLLLGGTNAPELPTAPDKDLLVLAGALSLGALVVDYIQYVFGLLATNSVKEAAEKSEDKEANFNSRDWRYVIRSGCFWVKQLLMLAGLWYLGRALLGALT